MQVQQLAKGARSSMNNKTLYLTELDRLRAANTKQQRKRGIPSLHTYRSKGCIKEQWENECIQATTTNTTTAVVEAEPSAARQYSYQRNPPRCGNCGTIGHKRTMFNEY